MALQLMDLMGRRGDSRLAWAPSRGFKLTATPPSLGRLAVDVDVASAINTTCARWLSDRVVHVALGSLSHDAN